MKTARTPQEIELWYIIPAIKREMAKMLMEKGYKQNKIAEMLSTTKSAISQYLSAKRAKEYDFNNEILEQIRKSLEEAVENKSSMNAEVQRIVKEIRKKGLVCELLRKTNSCVPEGCRICMEDKDDISG